MARLKRVKAARSVRLQRLKIALGVNCKSCGLFMPLEEVWGTNPRKVIRTGNTPEEFVHTCSGCGQKRTYHPEDIVTVSF